MLFGSRIHLSKEGGGNCSLRHSRQKVDGVHTEAEKARGSGDPTTKQKKSKREE